MLFQCLPPATYISGSYALSQINPILGINNNDVDIYMHINSSEFDIKKACIFILELFEAGYVSPINMPTGLVIEFMRRINAIRTNHVLNELFNSNIDDGDNGYVNDDAFSVFKMSDNNGGMIDIILIQMPIEDYINKYFDLSICKNYIKPDGSSVSLYKEHVDSNISEYKLSFLKKRLHSPQHITKFINRIYKYSNRGIHIYLTAESSNCYSCNSGDIKCDIHSVLLSKDNMDFMVFNIVNLLIIYHRENMIQLTGVNGGITAYEGAVNINSIPFSLINLLLPTYQNVGLLRDIILTEVNRMFLLLELKRTLLHPKYFDVSILEE